MLESQLLESQTNAAAASICCKVHARIGLLGNPSDGYHGKTISCSLANFYAEVLFCSRHSSCYSCCGSISVYQTEGTVPSLYLFLAAGGPDSRTNRFLPAPPRARCTGVCLHNTPSKQDRITRVLWRRTTPHGEPNAATDTIQDSTTYHAHPTIHSAVGGDMQLFLHTQRPVLTFGFACTGDTT